MNLICGFTQKELVNKNTDGQVQLLATAPGVSASGGLWRSSPWVLSLARPHGALP